MERMTNECILNKVLASDIDRTTVLFAEMALRLSKVDPEAKDQDFDVYMINNLGLTPEEVDLIIHEYYNPT